MEFQTTSAAVEHKSPKKKNDISLTGLLLYFILGIIFGIVLTKGEVISWFRIQEMFRFQSFYMYGVFATAIPVGVISVYIIKKTGMRSFDGQKIIIPPKRLGKGYRYVLGGLIFGIGWAFTGACPGPLFALFGNGIGVFIVAIASAVIGTWTYGYLRPKLPH